MFANTFHDAFEQMAFDKAESDWLDPESDGLLDDEDNEGEDEEDIYDEEVCDKCAACVKACDCLDCPDSCEDDDEQDKFQLSSEQEKKLEYHVKKLAKILKPIAVALYEDQGDGMEYTDVFEFAGHSCKLTLNMSPLLLNDGYSDDKKTDAQGV
jgi:hypothetical protein